MALYVAVEQPLPADLPGWLVEPCLYSPLPVFVEVGFIGRHEKKHKR